MATYVIGTLALPCGAYFACQHALTLIPVSYTHLTLPTILLV